MLQIQNKLLVIPCPGELLGPIPQRLFQCLWLNLGLRELSLRLGLS